MLTLKLVTLLTLSQTAGQVLPPGSPPWMTGQSRPEDLSIVLVTFSPGDTLTEWWGHTAMVVEDTRLHDSRLYNYGMFGFDQGFVKHFIMGRLEFWVSDGDSVMGTFRFYQQALNRDVRLQELNLLPAQAMQIAKALGTNVLPANRMYLYQHYDDNCSTRPRDLIDAAIGGQLKAATAGPSRMSLREHTLRYSMVNPPMSLVLDYLQNDRLDIPITQQTEAYLPDELERQVQALTVTRDDGSKVPLVKRQYDWFKSNRPRPPEKAPNWTPWLLLLGLGFVGVGHALGHLGRDGARWARLLLGLQLALYGLVFGVLGLALGFIGTFTDHLVAHHNENLFLVSPVTIAFLPLGLMLMANRKRAKPGLLKLWLFVAGLNVLGVALKVLPPFDQNNWNLIALFTPINLGFAALFWLSARYEQKKRPTPATP